MDTQTLALQLSQAFKKNKKNIYAIKDTDAIFDFFFVHLYNYTEDCFNLINPHAVYLCLQTYLESSEKVSKKIPMTYWLEGLQTDKNIENFSLKDFRHLYKHVLEVLNLTKKHHAYIDAESLERFDFQRPNKCPQAIRPELEIFLPDNKEFDNLKEECASYVMAEDFSEFDFVSFIMDNYTNVETIEAVFPECSLDKETSICTDLILMIFEEELADHSEEVFTRWKHDPNMSDEEIISNILEGWQSNKYWVKIKALNLIEGGKLYRPITAEYFALVEQTFKSHIEKKVNNIEMTKKLSALEEMFKKS